MAPVIAATQTGRGGELVAPPLSRSVRTSADSPAAAALISPLPISQSPIPRLPVALPSGATRPRAAAWGSRVLTFCLGLGLGVGAASVFFLRPSHPPKESSRAITAQPATGWARVEGGTTENLYGVWGADAKDIWAVGSSGQVIHYDGAAWQRVTLPAKTPQADSLRAIWGSGRQDIWVAGKAGVLFHYDGSKWTEVPTGTDQNLYCIWGLSATDWWTGGRQGVLLHSDGKELLPVDLPTQQQVRSIWASAPSDLWAVAASDANEGTILHFDGQSWSQHSESARLNQIWGSRKNDVWVAGGGLGNRGVVLHYSGDKWSPIELADSQWLLGLWGSGRRGLSGSLQRANTLSLHPNAS